MKTSILCLFVVVLVIGLTFCTAETCQEGDVKKDGCNTCRCVNGLYACTKKFCLKNKREALAIKHILNENRLKRATCQPGTSYKKDCNTCVCSATGKAACTLKACL